MTEVRGLLSPGFLVINLQFALVTAIAAQFFAFAGYLQLAGIDPRSVGLILSADALAALIIQPLIAPFIRAGNARRWLVGGSLLLAAALMMLTQVTSVVLLIGVRLLQGAGFICVLSALIALVVRFIPPAMSGRAFGWISLVRLIPYALIPFFFDLFSISSSSFPSLLHAAALVALLPALMLLLPAARRQDEDELPFSPGLAGMIMSLRSPAVAMLLLSALLFFCGYAAVFFYLKEFIVAQSIGSNSLFFTTATLMMIAVRLLGSGLFDRCSKVWLCAAGLLLVSVSYALLPLCTGQRELILLAGTTGIGWGIVMPLQAAAMFDLSLPADRAMNQNLLVVTMQGGFFLGPVIGGQLLACGQFGLLFFVLAGLTLVASLITFCLRTQHSDAPNIG